MGLEQYDSGMQKIIVTLLSERERISDFFNHQKSFPPTYITLSGDSEYPIIYAKKYFYSPIRDILHFHLPENPIDCFLQILNGIVNLWNIPINTQDCMFKGIFPKGELRDKDIFWVSRVHPDRDVFLLCILREQTKNVLTLRIGMIEPDTQYYKAIRDN